MLLSQFSSVIPAKQASGGLPDIMNLLQPPKLDWITIIVHTHTHTSKTVFNLERKKQEVRFLSVESYQANFKFDRVSMENKKSVHQSYKSDKYVTTR